MIPPQKHNGGSDCGVFAIAFATSIAISIAIHQNVDVKFDQARMRAYLANCIEKREFSLFPSKLLSLPLYWPFSIRFIKYLAQSFVK